MQCPFLKVNQYNLVEIFHHLLIFKIFKEKLIILSDMKIPKDIFPKGFMVNQFCTVTIKMRGMLGDQKQWVTFYTFEVVATITED